MIRRLLLILVCVQICIPFVIAREKPVLFERFNAGWLFNRGEFNGAQYTTTADSSWRTVNIPHDWSIENLPGTDSPFSAEAVTGVSGGFSTGGVGWYRKHFYVEGSFYRDHFLLSFDGVYMNADVWVNNRYVGNHLYGYTGFEFDITDYIRYGENNLIAVRVRNEGLNCRWYTGSGIYREAMLKIVSSVHLKSHGTYITTSDVSAESATISIVSSILNKDSETVRSSVRLSLLNRDNKIVARAEGDKNIKAGEIKDIEQEIILKNPLLWSPEEPVLYKLVTEIVVDEEVVDKTEQLFGIRTISFDAAKGFQLNGKTVLLKGGCIHHDHGPLGAKAFPRAEERKIELLKQAGFNALRMAHNPPSKALLDACDRLGILVIDEAFDSWRYGHYPSHDFSQYFDQIWQQELTAMIVRDRNHPSVVMWSIGNEIPGNETPEIVTIARELGDYVRSLDPTRPVTAGVNKITDQTDGFLQALDLSGYNYAPERYLIDHDRHPERVIYGSESYASKAYDYWQCVMKYPWVIGDFIWTAFDYLGESSIGWRGYPLDKKHYPWNHAFCGDLDINGKRRPQSLFRETLWSNEPVVYLAVTPPNPSFELNPDKEEWSVWDWPDAVTHWTFPGQEGKEVEVVVYTNCASVELFLNDRSLGQKTKREGDKNKLTWSIPYESGQIRAVGLKDGKKIASDTLRTAGKASRIRLKADRNSLKADGKDLSYIHVCLTDENGVTVPSAQNKLYFTITGDASIEAVSNSDPMSTEAFVATSRKAWRGEAVAIIRSGFGKTTATLTITAEGLPAESISIKLQ